MRGQGYKRTHSTQGNAGYIYEAKRREIKEIETMRGARVCRGFDFSVKTCFDWCLLTMWIRYGVKNSNMYCVTVIIYMYYIQK